MKPVPPAPQRGASLHDAGPARIIVDQSRTPLSERPMSMRTLRSAACLTLTLTLFFAGGAAFAQSASATTAAPATTVSSAAPTTGTAAATATTSTPEASATAPAPVTTASSEAPTTEAAAATTAPAEPPSWTPAQQLAATTAPAATGPSPAATTLPETAPSPAGTTSPETAPSPAATAPPETAPSPAATTPAATASAAATTTTAPLPSGPPPAASGQVLNFNDAPIDLVLKYLAESAGLQVVKQVPMTDVRVTIIGQKPIFLEDTIELLNSALNVKGYAAVKSGPDGRILKIVSSEDAKKLNVPVHKGTQPNLIPTTDEIITQVMPLRYIDATRLRQDLTPLISASASITSNAAGNSLVVTDTSANVHRIAEVVWALDTNPAGATEVRIYSLKNADAASAVKLITDIFKPDTTSGPGGFFRGVARFMMGGRGGGGGGGATTDQTAAYQPPNLKASADVRTNSVVVTGPSESLLVVDKIIEKLESNTIEPQGVFVYALKNGTAADIAPVLNNIMGTSTSATGVGTRSTQPGMSPGGGASANASLASQNGLYGQVYVVANTDTNSLLVMTMPKYFEQVKGILKTLDRPIPQVLIRVLIAEITHDDTVDLGADFSMLNLTSAAVTGDVYGGQLSTNVAELPNPAAGGLTFSSLSRDFSSTIRALQTIGNLDILSRPYILASDNQKATFQDVVQYPFASGSREDVNGNVDTSVTWQTLGISLNVTPHINPDGIVTMLVNPEIDTLTGQVVQITAPTPATGTTAATPGLSEQVWGKRLATSQVAVRNGQTIVIGGMIQDQETDTINKVPVLGDLPLIGYLFRHTVREKNKQEVLIFLTPIVAMTPEALRELSKAEEQSAGKELHNAVAPGAYQRHLDGMGLMAPTAPPTQTDPSQPLLPQTPQTPTPQTPAPQAEPSQTPTPQTPNP